jgi:3'-5' exonuclease
MANGDDFNRTNGDGDQVPAFLVVDTESVPDGRLLSRVKYADLNLSPDEAVCKAQEEAREASRVASDFLPVTFHYPVAVCVLRVGNDFGLQSIRCLDAPVYRPRCIVEEFWRGVSHYKEKYGSRVKLVTFNGRGFDLPLLELAAFRYGCCGRDYFLNSRNRFNGEIDLMDWLTNYGAYRMAGGLDLLSKLVGKPGKMEVAGDQVYAMYRAGRLQDVNDYCMCDTLDTYFVFLRTRVVRGDISLAQEQDLVVRARAWLESKSEELPALRQYLANWSEWEPWP